MSQSSADPVTNPEVQRLLLLQAMGIRSYYPRFQLPGARPSVACAWLAEAEVAGSAPMLAESAVPTPASAPAAAPAATAPTPAPRAAGTKSAAASVLSFQVLLLQADKGLAICNQLPALARPALGRAEQQLLNNLLLWLGCSLQPGAAQRHFSWPLPGLPTADASLAGKSLQGFLAQARQETGFTRLLVMGSNSVDCLLPLFDGTEQSWQIWHTHSLSELLAMPVLKRSAWQQLQTLHAGLR